VETPVPVETLVVPFGRYSSSTYCSKLEVARDLRQPKSGGGSCRMACCFVDTARPTPYLESSK
jgi:hypothetical protein